MALLAGLLLITATIGSAESASATMPDPSAQGGANGVIYFTEATDGAIYVGDFNSTTKQTFWSAPGSDVDQVAVTGSRIAWASGYAANGSVLRDKIFISDIGTSVGTITEVTVPGSVFVRSLAADHFGEKFYFTTSDGNVYSVTSDGSGLQKLTSSPVASVRNVDWGMWVDPYNQTLTYCTKDVPNKLYQASITGSTLGSPTELAILTSLYCDGIGVDPATGMIFIADARSTSSFATYLASRTPSLETVTYATPPTGVAPSSMFVSHATLKFYFSTETGIFESSFDGSALRSLYSGIHNANGFQNIAVYFGADLNNISSIAASRRPVPPANTGGGGAQALSSSQLAATGTNRAHILLLSTLTLLAGGIVLAVIRTRPKRKLG